MYVRPQGDRVKVPENYSGHAFRDQSPYGDMPPPAHISQPPTQKRERPDIHSQSAPHISASPLYDTRQWNHGEEKINDATPEAETATVVEKDKFERENVPEDAPRSESESKSASIFSSLLPAVTSASGHFPFGHGIGSEELLILAIMLLVFLSEESDQELLLLLGFLLFAG